MRDDDKYPTIRVTNVSEDTTDEDLKQLFGRFGEWDHVNWPMLTLHHTACILCSRIRGIWLSVVPWFAYRNPVKAGRVAE